MTSMPLHSMPRWRTVAGEQIRTVGLMTRKAGFALLALIAIVLVIVIPTAIKSRSGGGTELRTGLLEEVTFAPWILLAAVIAALFALAIWRDEELVRRNYQWMMPVEPHVHALTKVLAGWVWLLAGATLWLVSIGVIGALSSIIAGHQSSSEIIPWWFGLAPITSATIAYVLVSAAAVGTRQPVMWVVGVILVYAALLFALDSLGYRDTYAAVRSAFNGEYGISAALFGDIARLDNEHLRMVLSVKRWLGASALWGGLGAILLVATAFRRAEPAVVGDRGPFRRAIFGHAWLFASVIALSIAAGIIATRVMKPQYEARATIWMGSRPSSRITVSVPAQQMTRVPNQIELLRSSRLVDTVVRELALYVRPDVAADSSLLRNFSVADRFMPGVYTLALNKDGTRWRLSAEYVFMTDSGATGDSIGRTLGLRWQPEPATLAPYSGREFHFTVGTPRQAAAQLLAGLSVVAPANSSFLQLALADPDPHRAARTLNAISSAYVARSHDSTGATKSVLDSAVAPLLPFKNSPAQLLFTSVVIGIAAAIALVFAVRAIERRFPS